MSIASLGYYDVLSFSRKQAGEIWLTAAQSFFAPTLLVDFEISVREALALLGLFAVQFHPYFQSYQGLLLFSGVYVVLGVVVLGVRRDDLRAVVANARRHARRSPPDEDPSATSESG